MPGTWRTSTHSGNNNACVEVSQTPTGVHIRDTKARANGTLTFSPTTFTAFLRLHSVVADRDR